MTIGDNVMRDMQSQSCTMPGCLGGKKRFKDARLDVWWDPRSIIHDLDDHLVILRIRSNLDFPFPIQRVDGIVNDVRPYLVEFAGVCLDPREICGILPPDRHALL